MPGARLSFQEQEEIKEVAIRYLEKPGGIQPELRFSAKYDSFYREAVRNYRLDAYQESGEYQYFVLSKLGAGTPFKRVATVGRMRFISGKLEDYEEFCRTKKLSEAELGQFVPPLFELLLVGGTLRGDQYPTFLDYPNEITYFDKQQRAWKRKEHSLN